MYVPMLAQAIIQYNAAGKTPVIPLAGIAVGNGRVLEAAHDRYSWAGKPRGVLA